MPEPKDKNEQNDEELTEEQLEDASGGAKPTIYTRKERKGFSASGTGNRGEEAQRWDPGEYSPDSN